MRTTRTQQWVTVYTKARNRARIGEAMVLVGLLLLLGLTGSVDHNAIALPVYGIGAAICLVALYIGGSLFNRYHAIQMTATQQINALNLYYTRKENEAIAKARNQAAKDALEQLQIDMQA